MKTIELQREQARDVLIDTECRYTLLKMRIFSIFYIQTLRTHLMKLQ